MWELDETAGSGGLRLVFANEAFAGLVIVAIAALFAKRSEVYLLTLTCVYLMATIGLGQLRGAGVREPALVTSGDDLTSIEDFLGARTHYGAADVVAYLAPPPAI